MSFQNLNTRLFILGPLSELTKRKTTLNRKAERIQEEKMWEEEALTKRKLGQRKKNFVNYAYGRCVKKEVIKEKIDIF